MTDVPAGHFHLGHLIDASTHERAEGEILYEASDLTTHGVIVGMTGSGKTGLGVILIEEALLQGVPTLVIDPKGDMGNLCLPFPDRSPRGFEPWIDEVAARREARSTAEVAAETADVWARGLERSGVGEDRTERLATAADVTIYTPGSQAGVPLNVIGSLEPPETDDDETIADEVESFASSILGLVDIEADPLSSPEHILVSNLVHRAWTNGETMDLERLIREVQKPPIRKLGVIDLESFYPESERAKLAMRLNGLFASPAFNSWMQGQAIDIESLLHAPDGRPRCSIISIAHLTDAERQFVVTLVLSKLVTWMRSQAGTGDLRALVYMDEVFGFVPPSAAPPAKKPILTILKQARAFGVGMVLSTQNPVDLDYKAISNAGTWMVGRLQTERDKGRLLEGMTSAGGGVDITAVDHTISGLGKREFLLHTTKSAQPQVFTTRWAMSYLAGPLTREQISELTERMGKATPDAHVDAPGAKPPTAEPGATALADDETPAAPGLAEGRRAHYLDSSAPWANEVGAVPGGTRLEPALIARLHLRYDERAADLEHDVEWEAVIHPIGEAPDVESLLEVDYDTRDLRDTPPEGARYVITEARLDTKTYFKRVETALRDHLYRNETLELMHNPELDLYSRVGENLDDFVTRCERAADDGADADADKIRKTLEAKIDRVRDAIAKAEDRVREVESDAKTRGRDNLLSGALDVLGGLLGGRKSTRSILGGVRRASSRNRQKQKAEERVRTAERRLAEKADELEDLEEELIDTLEDIQEDWESKADSDNIETTEVPLEKADITIAELDVLWIPKA
jgi:hypothetical protein